LHLQAHDALAVATERSRAELMAALRAEMAKLGDSMRARLDTVEQRITELAADNAALRAQVGEQKAHIARLQDEATKLQEEVGKLRSEGVELRSDVSAVRAAMQVVDFEGLVVHALHANNIGHNPLFVRMRAAAIAARSPDVAAAIRALQKPVSPPGTASGTPAAGSTVVEVSSKSIADAGAAAIAKALAARPSSTVAKVRRPNCRMPLLGGVLPDSTVSMFFFLFATVLLGRQLVLSNNAIGDAGARALAGALAANTTLQFLQLQANSIGVAGGAALAKVLTVNHTLTDVCSGQLRDGGCGPTTSGQPASWRWCVHCLLCLLAPACSSVSYGTRLATRVRPQWPRCSLSTARWRRWSCKTIRLGPRVHLR